ncbi:MAG: methyltransferase domain-containing protein [Rickettsiales bacterium]|nr:methyltransferase domain-containing protein [Rickettsiales bacterium]
MQVFDRKIKKKHFERIANSNKFENHKFLAEEVASRLVSNFGVDIVKNFEKVLNIGDKKNLLKNHLKNSSLIGEIFSSNVSEKLLEGKNQIVCDEEFLPFSNGSFDLIISNLNLHWVNDLVGFLVQAKNILKSDGFFIASIFGGATLKELSQVFLEVGSQNNRVTPRISPFADAKDMAGLLQRAGFSEPVAITETIIVQYENLKDLLYDLRYSGEGNVILKADKNYAGRDFFQKAEEIYRQKFADNQGLLPASFEIITFSGWKTNKNKL